MQGCKDTGIQGYRDTRQHGSLGIYDQGSLFEPINKFKSSKAGCRRTLPATINSRYFFFASWILSPASLIYLNRSPCIPV